MPEELTPDQITELGDLIVEKIVDRTLKGKDKDGQRFPGYSKSYKESLDFKNAGKSASNVNLELSGDMLAALQVLKEGKTYIDVGFEEDTPENARADGNIRGTYGKQRGSKAKARNFLGISDDELRKLIKNV